MSHSPIAALATVVPPRVPGFDLEHEWRTPMTVIQSAAEVLRGHDDLSEEERNLFLDALLEETLRLRACLEMVMAGEGPHASGRWNPSTANAGAA